MGLMAAQRAAPGLARDAWAEMYRRHSRYVTVVIVRAFGDRARDADVASDIVTDTFRTAFDWTGRQSPGEDLTSRFSASDRDAVRRKVLGFLAVVAKRLARRFATEAKGRLEFLRSDPEATDPSTDEGTETPEPSLTDKMLDLLTFEEAEVLRVSLPWYEPQTGEFAPPRDEAARIASTLGITPDALRQRRHRSLQKLATLLQDAFPRSGVSNRSPIHGPRPH